MKRIGLTGGIGSGKSTVAEMFDDLGAVIIDADALARQLMEPGEEVLAKTVEEFGAGILHEDGTLDRVALAGIIFGDDAARERLNAIVHPAVRQKSAQVIESLVEIDGFSGVVIEDIPLLTETGQADRFDGVIVVEVQPEVRLERLVGQRGMSEEDARARMGAQASDEQRRQIATWLINNSGTLNETQAQVERIWGELTGDQ